MVFTVALFLAEGPQTEEVDVEILFESLKQQKDGSVANPTYISSVVCFLMNLKDLFSLFL